jgi:hypothetical protein
MLRPKKQLSIDHTFCTVRAEAEEMLSNEHTIEHSKSKGMTPMDVFNTCFAVKTKKRPIKENEEPVTRRAQRCLIKNYHTDLRYII